MMEINNDSKWNLKIFIMHYIDLEIFKIIVEFE
jgi:hypothetical protein